MMSVLVMVWLMLCSMHPARGDTNSGDWCVCSPQGRTCDPAVLRFKPQDGSPTASYIQEDMASHEAGGMFPVIIDRPVLPVVIQAMSIAALNTTIGKATSTLVPQEATTGTTVSGGVASSTAFALFSNFIPPLTKVDSGYELVAHINTTDPSAHTTFNSAKGEAGEFTFSELTVTASSVSSVGAVGHFNFTLHAASGGPVLAWISSPQFTLRINPTSNAATSNFRLKFPRFYSFFTSNYVLNEKIVVLDRPLPDIVVELVDIGDYPSETENNKRVVATASYVAAGVGNITMVHSEATMKGSRATFKKLTITNDTVPNAEFRITFTIPGAAIVLVSHVLRAASVKAPNYRLVLGSESESFVSDIDRPLFALLGTPLPPIVVYLTDSSQLADTTSTGTFITAHCERAVITGHVAEIRDGRAAFNQLTIKYIKSLDNAPDEPTARRIVLAFVAGFQQNIAAAGKPVFSPPITVYSTDPGEPVGIRFRHYEGYIRYSTAELLATRSRRVPPIIVEQFGVDNKVFPQLPVSSSMRLTSIPEDAVRGTATKGMDDGVATFTDIDFSTKLTAQEVALKFSVNDVGELSVPSVLVRDVVQPATSMRFEDSAVSLFIAEGQDTFATQNQALLPIVIEILNSEGELDTTANEVVITAKANIFAENMVAVSQGGRVVFDRIVFGGVGSTRLQFTAVSAAGHSVSGHSLWSGYVGLEANIQPRYDLGFTRDSYLHHGNQPFVTSLSTKLPPIGVVVLRSDHTVDRTAINVVIECTATGHPLAASSVTSVLIDRDTHTAWFKDLVFDTGYPVEARLHFKAVFNNTEPTLVQQSRVVGKTISSGVINFVPAQTTLFLNLVPYDGSKEGYPVRNDTSPSNVTTYVNDEAKSTKYFHPTETSFEVTFDIKQSSGSNTPPDDAETGVYANASLPLEGSTARFNTEEKVTPIIATFDNLRLLATPYIEGFFYMLTFTSEWIPNRPTKVGPFYDLSAPSDAAHPVVVAEVQDRAPSFSVDQWSSSLSDIMNIPASRIEITRLRHGGSSTTEFNYQWEGTRVELRFLPPTTSSEDKASSSQLASMFIGMKETDTLKLLKIRNKYLLTEDTSCDLFRIEEQISAAKRCVSTSPASERCSCHIPLFELLGDRCKETGPILGVCSQLRRCTSETISGPCFAFETQVYIQYLLIATYTLLAVIAMYVFWAWRTGRFERARRRKLGGKAAKKHASGTLVLPEEESTKPLDVVI